MIFKYSIYGLHLVSNRQIKLLTEGLSNDLDLEVVWTTVLSETPHSKYEWESLITSDIKTRKGISFFGAGSGDDSHYKLHFDSRKSKLQFIFHPHGKKLWVVYSDEDTATDIDSQFVGPVLGCVLRLRGTVCLHASVVNIDNKAVLLLGKKKTGKSTTAAAFARLGYEILADDIGVITEKNNSLYIEPGYPKVRLRPKSLEVMHADNAEALQLVYSHRNSKYSDVENSFCDHALLLGAIYVIGEVEEPQTEPFIDSIPMSERMVRLNENIFGNYVITRDLRMKEFSVLGQIANTIPVRRTVSANNLNHLYRQCQTIIDDYRLQKNVII